MPQDAEVDVIKIVVEAFERLSEDAQRRVALFIGDRYGRTREVAHDKDTRPTNDDSAVPSSSILVSSLSDLEALFAAAKATAQWERALITGCWLQEVRNQADFDAMAVNLALRQCGYGISNITRELNKLAGAGLVAVQQGAEGGKERRRFRVSREGLRWYEQRLRKQEVQDAR